MLSELIDTPGFRLGTPQSVFNLTVIPLVGGGSSAVAWLTLDEALAGEMAQITEVSDSGNVPELRFQNNGDRPILLLDGEELIGAKQNRILNLTVLAPPFQDLLIPVSCVERGRWSWQSQRFSSADRALYGKLRRRKVEQVSRSMKEARGRCADQSDIWRQINVKSAAMRAFSETEAVSALFDSNAARVDGFVEQCKVVPDQVGAIFVLRGRICGAELFGASNLFAKLFPKLVRSYAIDAIEDEDKGGGSDVTSVLPETSYLDRIFAAETMCHRAIGLGVDVRIESREIVGAALVHDKSLVHLSAFSRSYV